MEKTLEENALSLVEWIGSGVGRIVNGDFARPIAIVRWILVVPASLFGFYAAVILTGWAVGLGTAITRGGRFSEAAFWLAVLFGVVSAPAFVVWFGAATAPSHRTPVAWILYLAGLGFAINLTWEMPVVLASVALAGACAAAFVHWYSQGREKT